MDKLSRHLAPVLLGSWLFVVGVVALATGPVPYRNEIPGALAIGVGALMLLRR